ncbi:Exocyst complex component 5, partial [Irineochytrium annulatum]
MTSSSTSSALDPFRVPTFHPRTYIESITRRSVAPSSSTSPSRTAAPFEPKPLIRTFETSLDELLKLRRKVAGKIEDLEDAAKASEQNRLRKLGELNGAVEDVRAAFGSLERDLGMVGKTAIRI